MNRKRKARTLPAPTVYVVDDDLTIRILLGEVFKAAKLMVETYACAEDFLVAYRPENCGCLLLDIMMPGMNGLELQEVIAAQGNTTPVIFLSASNEVRVAVTALKAGAIDFIEKPVEPKVVLKRVKNAMELDQRNRNERFQHPQIEQRIKVRAPREREVMEWIVRGKPNKTIARILGISTRTVELHRGKVIDKMHAISTADLLQMVLKAKK